MVGNTRALNYQLMFVAIKNSKTKNASRHITKSDMVLGFCTRNPGELLFQSVISSFALELIGARSAGTSLSPHQESLYSPLASVGDSPLASGCSQHELLCERWDAFVNRCPMYRYT